jgi:hypothetical protein
MPVSVHLTSSGAEPLTAPQRFERPTELTIGVLIFCIGTFVGVRAVHAFRSAGGAQYFYQTDFGPAVMLACGRGFQDPDPTNVPALAAFLAQRADSFDCRNLPPGTPTAPMNAFQRSSQYLEAAVALTWKAVGVSWSRLALLNGALFGAVAALTYGLLRLAMSRTLALLALLPSVTSTPNFMLVPQLRDYAKGPFLLAVILILGLLVIGRTGRGRAIGLSALAGAVVGLGLGFRMDLVIAVVPVVVTVACLLPSTLSIRVRVSAIGMFFAALILVAFPILRGYVKGGNAGHVVLLGLGAGFDGPLRIEPSIYEFAGQYNDTLAFSIINSYAIRLENRRDPVALASAEYERTAGNYLAHIAAVFPADVITRVLAAIRAVPKYFLDSSLYPPVHVRSPFLRDVLYPLRARVLWRLGQIALFACAAATLLVAAVNPRAAWLAVVVLTGFAGATAIQFHERHFYYLQFVPWFAFGLLAQAAMRGRAVLAHVTAQQVRRAVLFTLIICVCSGMAVVVTRAYQQRTAARLFERYEAAPRMPLAAMLRPVGGGRTLVATEEWLAPLPAGRRWIEAQLVALQFDNDLCGSANLPLTIRYSGNPPDVNLSEPITIPLRRAPKASTLLFIATNDRADESIRFRGVEVGAHHAQCVSRLWRVEGLDGVPLLLTTTLAADWRAERLFQRLR